MISLCVACCFLDVDLVWWPWSLLSLSVQLSICLSHEWSVDDQYVCLLAAFLMLISCGDFDQGQYCVCLSVSWSVCLLSICLSCEWLVSLCLVCGLLDVNLQWRLWPGSVLCWSVCPACLSHECCVDDQSACCLLLF